MYRCPNCGNKEEFYRECTITRQIYGRRDDIVREELNCDGDVEDSETTYYGDSYDIETDDFSNDEVLEEGTVYCTECDSEAEEYEEGDEPKPLIIEGEEYV